MSLEGERPDAAELLARFKIADQLFRSGQHELAVSEYRKLRADSDHPQDIAQLMAMEAHSLVFLNRIAEAEELFYAARQLQPDNKALFVSITLDQVRLHIFAKEWEAALLKIENIEANYSETLDQLEAEGMGLREAFAFEKQLAVKKESV